MSVPPPDVGSCPSAIVAIPRRSPIAVFSTVRAPQNPRQAEL